jgi:mevalonate kinase
VTACAFAHGKVILAGEHAVLFGAPALAVALRLGARAAVVPGTGALRLGATPVQPDPAGAPLARAWAALRAAAGLPARGEDDAAVSLDFPLGAGLGSSAAIAVAAARALLGAAGVADEARVAAGAAAFEEVVHGRASGVDACLAQHGGVGLFHRGGGLFRIAAPPLRLAIGLSGETRSTSDAVAAVARRRLDAKRAVDALMKRLGDIALRAAEHLSAGRLAALGRDLDAAHAVLSALDVSSPGLDALCDVARRAGALGAKLTGAGRGGAVVALAPSRETEIVAAWRASGFAGFVAEVEGSGQ